jgi:hypothetical protein
MPLFEIREVVLTEKWRDQIDDEEWFSQNSQVFGWMWFSCYRGQIWRITNQRTVIPRCPGLRKSGILLPKDGATWPAETFELTLFESEIPLIDAVALKRLALFSYWGIPFNELIRPWESTEFNYQWSSKSEKYISRINRS